MTAEVPVERPALAAVAAAIAQCEHGARPAAEPECEPRRPGPSHAPWPSVSRLLAWTCLRSSADSGHPFARAAGRPRAGSRSSRACSRRGTPRCARPPARSHSAR
jgi:hypothetical protein